MVKNIKLRSNDYYMHIYDLKIYIISVKCAHLYKCVLWLWQYKQLIFSQAHCSKIKENTDQGRLLTGVNDIVFFFFENLKIF